MKIFKRCHALSERSKVGRVWQREATVLLPGQNCRVLLLNAYMVTYCIFIIYIIYLDNWTPTGFNVKLSVSRVVFPLASELRVFNFIKVFSFDYSGKKKSFKFVCANVKFKVYHWYTCIINNNHSRYILFLSFFILTSLIIIIVSTVTND